MRQRLKERLVGAVILILVGAVFIPLLLSRLFNPDLMTTTNIPPRPVSQFEPVTLQPLPSVESLEPVVESVEPSIDGMPVQKIPDSVTVEETKVTVSQASPLDNAAKGKEIQGVSSGAGQTSGLSAWVVQLGSFSDRVNAEALSTKLKKEDFPAFVDTIIRDEKTVYRVRVGPELLRSNADALLKDIDTRMKLKGIVLSHP